MKVIIQVYFCKVAGENEKKLLPEIFLSQVSKKKSPHGCFQNLATSCKSFSGENKEKKTTTLQETKADQIF